MTEPSVLQALASDLSGVALYADPIDLLNYRRDCSMVAAGKAELAAQPRNAEEVIEVVKQAAAHATPVVSDQSSPLGFSNYGRCAEGTLGATSVVASGIIESCSLPLTPRSSSPTDFGWTVR